MDNSQAFKQAHAMTKAIIKHGDSYQVTFGECLRYVISQQKAIITQASVKVAVRFYQAPVAGYACALLCLFFLIVCASILVSHWVGLASNVEASAKALIEAFQVGSAFGVASLILAAVYKLIGWGAYNDVASYE